MGLSDYPSNSRKRLEGIAVGLFVRYPRVTRPYIGYTMGYTTVTEAIYTSLRSKDT